MGAAYGLQHATGANGLPMSTSLASEGSFLVHNSAVHTLYSMSTEWLLYCWFLFSQLSALLVLAGLAIFLLWFLLQSCCCCRGLRGFRAFGVFLMAVIRSGFRWLMRPETADKGLQVETVLLHGQRTDGLKIILRNFGCSTQGLRDELENRIVSMLNYKHRNTDWYIGSAFSHIPGTNMIQQRVEHE